jgi:thioredoxin-related protein
MKSVLFSFLLFFICFKVVVASTSSNSTTDKEPASLVNWLTFKEALALNKVQPKPILIDFYTDWCGWCKHMMSTTYSTPDIATYINTYFYPIKFNAEGQDSIYFKDSLFVNRSKATRSTHNLTPYFLGSNLMYPSTVFISPDLKFTFATSGFLDLKGIEPFLVYMLENVYQTTNYDDFKKGFNEAYFDSSKVYTKQKITFLDFKTLQENKVSKPKKSIVNIYTNFCNSCKVMNNSTYKDSNLVAYINSNFNAIGFDAQTKLPISINGTVYDTTLINGMVFHKLALALTRNQLSLPSTVILDENNQLLDVIPRFIAPAMLDAILHFYNENAYKTTPWDQFLAAYRKKQKP